MMTDDSYGGLKGRISGIIDHIKDAQSPLQKAIEDIDGQIAAAMAANDDSQALDPLVQILMEAKQHCEDAIGLLGVATKSAEEARAELK